MRTAQETIPKGWQQVKLGEVADITNGKTNSQDAVLDGQYPLFDRSVTIKRSNKFLFDKAAIILPGEGAEFVPRYYSGKFDLHQRAYAIFPYAKSAETRYLFYFLDANKNIFVQKSVGSTVRSLRLPIIESVPVILPPISEQKKIVEILVTVDAEIRKTDEIIITTEELKKGLVRQLFTRGIGHTKFKKTKLGDIPAEWIIESFKDSSIEIIDGDRGVNYPKQTDFFDDGYGLFLSNKNIKNDAFLFEDCSFITKEKDEVLRKGKLKRFDVVLTTRGTVGNVAFYGGAVPFENIRINSGMIILRVSNDYDPEFLYHLMRSDYMKKKYTEMASGSAQPQLPIHSLENILLIKPKLSEQKEIVAITKSVDEKISVNKKLKEKLILLKKGLMQDLFSGKVRVNKSGL